MKSIYISLLLLVCLFLATCDNTRNENFFSDWSDFPEEKFSSYAPYDKGDTVSFYSLALDSVMQFSKSPFSIPVTFSYYQDDRNQKEVARAGYTFKHNLFEFSYGLESINRECIADYRYCKYIDGYKAIHLYSEEFVITDELSLPDTLKLTSLNNNNYCTIVLGKGLVEFFVNDELWTLVE